MAAWGDLGSELTKDYVAEFSCFGGSLKTVSATAEANGKTIVLECCDVANGFYLNGTTCTACYYKCKTCNGTLSGNCLGCDTATRDLISGSCICKKGYYDDGSSQACLACDSLCLTCSTSATRCLSCIIGAY